LGLDEIFQHDEAVQADVDFYVKGIVTAGIRLLEYEAAEEVIYCIYVSYCAYCAYYT
jgi:hypothetical protein